MVDTELIRKAAAAIWDAMGVGRPETDAPFDSLAPEIQEDFVRMAEAALKVFYEHTRGQTRERKPPNCPDCGQVMTPGETHQGVWFCRSCGRSQ